MKKKHLVIGIASLLILSACSSNNSSDRNKQDNTDPDNPIVETSPRDFNDFVIDLVQNETSDSSEPIAINELVFEFEAGDSPGNNEDEIAFNVLL